MITPNRSSFIPLTFTTAACAFVMAGYFALPALAATPPPDPVPSVSLSINKTSEHASSASAPASSSGKTSNPSGKGNGKGNSGALSSAASSSDATYTITVRNSSKFAAKNLAVIYTFYNKTTNTNNGKSTYSIEPISSTENVDIDPGKTKDVETQPISHASSMTETGGSSSGGGGRHNGGGASSSASSSSSITALLGWHVEVRFNDKIIKQVNQPDNLQDLLKEYPGVK